MPLPRVATDRAEAKSASPSSTYQPIVIRVRADPDPDHRLARFPAEAAIVIADPNRETIFTSLQAPETERWMTRIPPPQMIVLSGESLNLGRERLE